MYHYKQRSCRHILILWNDFRLPQQHVATFQWNTMTLFICCAFSPTYVIVPLTSLWNINPKPQSHYRLFLPVLCGTLHDSVDDSAARRHDTSAFVTVHSVQVDQTCAETYACSPRNSIDRRTLIHLDRLMYIYEKCYFTDI